jgi:hypothetical protein
MSESSWLDDLAVKEKAATAAPWHVSNSTDIDTNLDGDERHCEWLSEVTAKGEDATEYLSLLITSCGLHQFAVPNAEFIAALRNYAPRLIAEVKAAREWLNASDMPHFEVDAREAYRRLVEQHDGEQNGGSEHG